MVTKISGSLLTRFLEALRYQGFLKERLKEALKKLLPPVFVKNKTVMTFEHLVKNIQKLKDVDPELCTKLRAYCYDLVGACQEVHKDIGPFVNELTYQDALLVELNRRGYTSEDVIKEYYFTVEYKGVKLTHPHKVDFFVTKKKVYIECKAINALGPEQRQQLWNYMRLTGIRIGILYNLAPFHDQCERYYLDTEKQVIYAF